MLNPEILGRLMALEAKVSAEIENSGLTQEGIRDYAYASNLSEIGTVLRDLKEAHEALDRIKSAVGKVYDFYRTAVVPSRMEDEGVDSLKITGVGRLGLTSDLNVSWPNKEAGMRWLEQIGSGDLITETVNAASLKAMLKRRLQSGEDIDSDIFDVKPFTRAAITKA